LVLCGGPGWLHEPVFAAVEQLGLSDSVLLPGYIAEAELPLWYNAAEVFVYPSLYEGFGLPPLEAMACGIPVIASDTSSLPEVVGDSGLTASPHEPAQWAIAMSRLFRDASLRSELAARGLERAQLFSWTSMARETIEVYRQASTQYPVSVGSGGG
jgi:glycosyltransferase involved in cell wall biosynthesis